MKRKSSAPREMTLREVAVLIQIEQAASPGPWKVKKGRRGEPVLCTADGTTRSTSRAQGEANVGFIVVARSAVPVLLRMLANRDRRIAELEKAARG